MRTIGYVLLFLSLIFTACNQKKPLPPELRDAESLMRTEPKTALQILQNMPVPDPANEEEYATYCLLLVQALDKDYETHTSDSLINVAIDYFSESGDKLRKAWSLYYGGRVYTDMKKMPEAAFHYLKAKEIADHTTDYHLRGLISNNLGTLYRDMDLLDQSFDLRFESLKYYELAHDTVGYIYALREIGYEYRLKKQYDSAMWYYNKAIDYSNIIQNYDVQNIVQLGIANVYSDQGLYNDVIFQLKNNVVVNKYNFDAINIFFGKSFYHLNELDSAIYYLSLAEKSDQIYVKTETYKTFYNLEKKRGNYEKAAFYHNQFLQCVDSLQSFTLSEKIVEMQAKYDLAKLINVGERLKYQKAVEGQIYIYILVFVLCISALSYYYYKYIKRKKEEEVIRIKKLIRRNKMKLSENQFVIEQNIELLSEKELQLIKNEVKHSQVTDLMRENEVLKSEIEEQEKKFSELLEKHKYSFVKENEQLLDRYNKLKEKEILLLKYIMTEDSFLSRLNQCCKRYDPVPKKELVRIIDKVNELYDGFANRLLITYPNLTQDDILMCCLMKIHLTPSEIAILMDAMPDAIYKRKQRIKERLNCHSNTSLDEFIYAY